MEDETKMIGEGEFAAVMVALICVLSMNGSIVVCNHSRKRKIFLMLIYNIIAIYMIQQICTKIDQTLLFIAIFIIYTAGFGIFLTEDK